MGSRNTQLHYGSAAKFFHWITALFIISAFALGIIAGNSDSSTEAGLTRLAWIYSIHKTIGVSIFFIALARIFWTLTQVKPTLLNAEHKLEAFAAELAHWLLYISMLLVPLTGWLHHAAVEGFAPILWPLGQSLPFVPKSVAVAEFFESLHFVFTKVLGATFLAHFAGAMKHHIIDKDNTLRRMLPGQPNLGAPPITPHSKTPMKAAFGVYAVALLAGSVLGLQTHDAEAVKKLSSVESQWSVTEGTLSISFVQFGGQVTGSFEDWTAQINYDETEQTGDVDVTIAITSVQLGQLTSDALGSDYFNSEAFPTAQFTGPIVATDLGLMVDGQLTLRGVTLPVQLPFNLDMTDGNAIAKGTARIDRRGFNVGDNQKTEDNIGFAVDISIDLTAQKNAP